MRIKYFVTFFSKALFVHTPLFVGQKVRHVTIHEPVVLSDPVQAVLIRVVCCFDLFDVGWTYQLAPIFSFLPVTNERFTLAHDANYR